MSLVAVINLRIQAESTEGTDTADTEKEFLLESVLPVASVEVICNLTVLVNVCFVVSIKEIEVCSADCHLPDAGCDSTSRECHAGSYPVTILVHDRLSRNLGEVLRVILGNLVALCRKYLCEITVTVEETYCDEVHVHVAGFLKIVAGKNTETTGVDAQG